MSLLDKLKKSSRSAGVAILSESKLFSEKELTTTPVPMINVALSGSIEGGLASGLTVLAGPSKHFKTSFALLMAAAYLKKHDDAVLMFYDSEFGSPQSYFESFGIDTSRVLHTPVTNIEELKFDMVHQLNEIERKDKVIIVIDSVGNIASKKEVDDAENMKSVADMTRAKALKGLFRMIIKGYHFVVNVEKSRFVKEKSKIPISVSWAGGIQKWSGLLDVAVQGGYVVKPKNGWYQARNPANDQELSGNVRIKQTLQKAFWTPVFENTDFAQHIEKRFKVGTVEMVTEEDDDACE
mgnify:CR=1 FL=1